MFLTDDALKVIKQHTGIFGLHILSPLLHLVLFPVVIIIFGVETPERGIVAWLGVLGASIIGLHYLAYALELKECPHLKDREVRRLYAEIGVWDDPRSWAVGAFALIYLLVLFWWVITTYHANGYHWFTTILIYVGIAGGSALGYFVFAKSFSWGSRRFEQFLAEKPAIKEKEVLGVSLLFLPVIFWTPLFVLMLQYPRLALGTLAGTYLLGLMLTAMMRRSREVKKKKDENPIEWQEAYNKYDTAYTEWENVLKKENPKNYFISRAKGNWIEIVNDKHRPYVDALIMQLSERLRPLKRFPKIDGTFDTSKNGNNYFERRENLETQVKVVVEATEILENNTEWLRASQAHIDTFIRELKPAFVVLNDLKPIQTFEAYIPFLDAFLSIAFKKTKHHLLSDAHADLFGSMRGIIISNAFDKAEKIQKSGALRQSVPMKTLINMVVDYQQKMLKALEIDERNEAVCHEREEEYKYDKLVNELTPSGYDQPHSLSFEETYAELLWGTGLREAHTDILNLPSKSDDKNRLPDSARFEHHWIVGGTGHGKTSALLSMILDDLKRVENRECSIIVIDSKGDLYQPLSRLKVFAKGQPLEDRLILVDPNGPYPLALNLFDAKGANSETLLYLIRGLIGYDLTTPQEALFRHVGQLLQVMPNATLQDFKAIMRPGGQEIVEKYKHLLGGQAKDFFDNEFPDEKEYSKTKKAILKRLLAIDDVFADMFKAPSSRLDIYNEIANGKVILISTDESTLIGQSSAQFGRFFISLIWNAITKRKNTQNAVPTFVYIDEAIPYLDASIQEMLKKARSRNVGLIIAQQDFSDIPPPVLSTLTSQPAIRMGGGADTPSHLNDIASKMGLDKTLLDEQPKGSFVTTVRGRFANQTIAFEIGRINKEPKMSADEYDEVITSIYDKYYSKDIDLQVVDEQDGTLEDSLPPPEEI